MVARDEFVLEIPRTDPLSHPLLLKIRHHLRKAGLRHLFRHGFALDGLDFSHGGGLEVVGGVWKSVDVLEDVHGFRDR